MNAVPPGSYLALSHPAGDLDARGMAKMAQTLNEIMAEKIIAPGRATVARFFDGLELAEPGLVPVSDWRPPADSPIWGPAALWAGVARKP
jgi:S-adenosyl methyltransferase